MNRESEYKLQRRVSGYHDIRMDGMTDLVIRAKGASVFDIGCNRGLVSFEMANNGATLCHGCDIDPGCIDVARGVFADLRAVESRFAVIDLTEGPNAVGNAFGDMYYDIVLCLATYHKLKRIMAPEAIDALFVDFGRRTKKFFGWRATGDKPDENEDEMKAIDSHMKRAGLRRIHTSYISATLGVAAIWSPLYK